MKVVAGDETGLVKVVSVEDGKVVNKIGKQSRDNAVQKMAWSNNHTTNTTEHDVAWVTKTGVVNQFNTLQQSDNYDSVSEHVPVPVAGFGFLRGNGENLPPTRMVSCSQQGTVDVVTWGEPSDDDVTDLSFDVTGPVETMDISDTRALFGGKERDLDVWDLETQQSVFKGRNVPHDYLDMRVPIWVTDASFLSTGETKKGNSYHTIVTSTGYSQLRLYDTRVQRQPVRDINLDDKIGHITCMTPVGDNTALCSDATGKIIRVDLGSGKELGSYKGIGGSIRSISMHPTLPVFACGGLDRIVRVYDVESRELMTRVYVKQRITSVLFDSEGKIEKKKNKSKRTARREQQDDDSDDDATDVWDELDERGTSNKKRTKKTRQS